MEERKYPWDTWTNGQAWRVIQNKDFTCFGASFSSQCYTTAYKLTLSVATSVFAYDYDDDVVFFQFYESDSLWKPNFKAYGPWREEQRKYAMRTRRKVEQI